MNRYWMLAVALCVAAGPALAQEDHQAHHPNSQKPAAPAAAPAGESAAADVDFEQHMQKMRALMDKMRATKNPQERQQLMQEHAQLMQEGMRMQRTAMANCPMMGESGMDMMQMMMDHMQQRESMMGQGMRGGDAKRRGTMRPGGPSP